MSENEAGGSKLALHEAMESPDSEGPSCVTIIRRLLARGANPHERNNDMQTPLHVAATMGKSDCLRLLLRAGSFVAVADGNGMYPLHLAVANGHIECVFYLLKYKSPLHVQEFGRGLTPLHIAAMAGNLEILSLLLEHNAPINVLDYEGMAPLHLASSNNAQDCVCKLINVGADIDLADGMLGLTALHMAAKKGYSGIVYDLLRALANKNALDFNRHTPVHMAAMTGNLLCLYPLIKVKANLNIATTDNGWTPLHYAVHRNQEWAVIMLLLAGASENVKDKIGFTPRDLAQIFQPHLFKFFNDPIMDLITNLTD